MQLKVLSHEPEVFDMKKHGLSFLIKADRRILFDTSVTDELKGIEIGDVDHLVLSHGHYDHTEGLRWIDFSRVGEVVCHPRAFEKKYRKDKSYIGPPFTLEEMGKKAKVILTDEPYWMGDAVFLGEIPRLNDFEGRENVGYLEDGTPDLVIDDSALAIQGKDGIVVVTGCSHSGICNIIEYAKRVTGKSKVELVIGGLHLFDRDRTGKTIEYFRKASIRRILIGHCTDAYAVSEFRKIGADKFRSEETYVC